MYNLPSPQLNECWYLYCSFPLQIKYVIWFNKLRVETSASPLGIFESIEAYSANVVLWPLNRLWTQVRYFRVTVSVFVFLPVLDSVKTRVCLFIFSSFLSRDIYYRSLLPSLSPPSPSKFSFYDFRNTFVFLFPWGVSIITHTHTRMHARTHARTLARRCIYLFMRL